MDFKVRKASKKKARGRLAIDGQTGCGKTFTSLLVGKCMLKESMRLPDGTASRITVIDTERNSAENYQDEFDFNVVELPPEGWNPKHYTEALHAAEKVSDVVILDSIYHEWAWCLARVDEIMPKFRNNKWAAWSEVRPPHDNFVDAMMASPAHIIATIRAKMATVQDKEGDRTVIREVGLESKQDDMIKYAFSVCLRMDLEHNGLVTKTRCRQLDGRVFPLPGESFARIYMDWLESGVADNDVAHTIEQAVALAVTRAIRGESIEDKRKAFADARGQLTDWCKARGRSAEDHEVAQKELIRVVRERVGADQKAAQTDEERARLIDAGKA